MGLDAWGVKIKNCKEWQSAFWNDILEDDEKKFIPKENYFFKETYDRRFHEFINDQVLKDFEDIYFSGDPCCSPKTLYDTSVKLLDWIEKNPNKDYINPENDGYNICSKEIKDLGEYLYLLSLNGFTMWFSM